MGALKAQSFARKQLAHWHDLRPPVEDSGHMAAVFLSCEGPVIKSLPDFVLKIESLSVSQVGHELTTFLSQPPKCWI